MEITNVVATATLTVPLDLEHLQQHLKGSVLQKATGHWLKYRLQPENRYIAFYNPISSYIREYIQFKPLCDLPYLLWHLGDRSLLPAPHCIHL